MSLFGSFMAYLSRFSLFTIIFLGGTMDSWIPVSSSFIAISDGLLLYISLLREEIYSYLSSLSSSSRLSIWRFVLSTRNMFEIYSTPRIIRKTIKGNALLNLAFDRNVPLSMDCIDLPTFFLVIGFLPCKCRKELDLISLSVVILYLLCNS